MKITPVCHQKYKDKIEKTKTIFGGTVSINQHFSKIVIKLIGVIGDFITVNSVSYNEYCVGFWRKMCRREKSTFCHYYFFAYQVFVVFELIWTFIPLSLHAAVIWTNCCGRCWERIEKMSTNRKRHMHYRYRCYKVPQWGKL